MIDFLSQYPEKQRVLIHINNTNPILVEDSPERAQLDAAGIEVSYDGMDIHL
jgi:pyrroloquinoline quinone biosynthesis protein B